MDLGIENPKVYPPTISLPKKRILAPSPTTNQVYLVKSWKTFATKYLDGLKKHKFKKLTPINDKSRSF